jgi:hypothetical protein
MFSDFLVRQIRTWVPIAVGWGISFLGLVLPADLSASLTMSLTAAITAGYYVLASELEAHVHPAFGWLLGMPKDRTKAPAPGAQF